jgi:organic radical activating enzyme
MNNPLQSEVIHSGKELPLMEHFYTLQGEGFHHGRPAYFVRLGGCDVGCHWCDVKESWAAGDHPVTPIIEMVKNAKKELCRFAVITGGEPVMYNLNFLCKTFINQGFELAIETSGAYPLSGNWHWICLSPKKRKPPKQEYYKLANELKVVVYNKDDLKWAEEHAAKINSECKLYLQAEWSKRESITPLLIDYVKQNPKWHISVQSHKYINIP